jgi:hypothetical protein
MPESRLPPAALTLENHCRSGARTMFDFGEWKSEVASRKNPDGTISFITMAPGASGFEFTVASASKRTLTIRDAQHEYVFEER